MTVREIRNAIDGHREREKERYDDLMYVARIVSFYATKTTTKQVDRPDKLFSLPSDRISKAKKIKAMKPIQRIETPRNDEQPNS